MKLELAKQQIIDNHPRAKDKIKENVFKALDNLSSLIDGFEPEQVEKIYEIEEINPDYFPKLSITAAVTILNLHQANSELSLDFILATVEKLAIANRPWEALAAFSVFGKHCRAEMSEKNINYLLKINRDIIEIVSHEILDEVGDQENPKKSNSMWRSDVPPQYKGLIALVKSNLEQFFPGSTKQKNHY